MEHFYQHLAKDHWLARIDARIKLLATLALLIMVISYQGFLFPLLVCGLCLAFWFQMRIPLRTIVMRFSEPLFIIAVLFDLKNFFYRPCSTLHHFLFRTKDNRLPRRPVTGLDDWLPDRGGRFPGGPSGVLRPFTEFLAGLSWLRIPRGFIEDCPLCLPLYFRFDRGCPGYLPGPKKSAGIFQCAAGVKLFWGSGRLPDPQGI